MATIGDRIKKARIDCGVTQEELALCLKTTKQAIYKYETGIVTNIPITKIQQIADRLGTTPAYLMGWEDDPEDDIFSYPNIEPLPKTYKVPLLGSIRCGTPTDCPEVYDGEVEVPDNVKADYALRCRGDSMINARIFDGDIVYIRRQPTVDSGQIAAVLVDGEATLKRVLFFPDHITLQAENPTFKPITLWEEQMQELHVLGLAVAFTSRVI